MSLLSIFEGIGVLLEPSKKEWTWDDDKQILAGGKTAFVQRLSAVNKDEVDQDQIQRLREILSRNDCEPSRLIQVSQVTHRLGNWLRAMLDYASS